MKKSDMVGVNEKGLRIGESHQRAKLTDDEIDLMRVLHEEDGYGYRKLAQMFNIGRTQARRICIYQQRVQYPSVFKRNRRP